MDLYSPDCAVLHFILGRKVFSKYSVQVRMKSDYINKVMCSNLGLSVVSSVDVAFSPLFVEKLKSTVMWLY